MVFSFTDDDITADLLERVEGSIAS